MIVRPNDTEELLKKKIEYATILGTLQASLTAFKYISDEWCNNCEEERLLGVSISGILDNPLTSNIEDIQLQEHYSMHYDRYLIQQIKFGLKR